MSDEPRSFDAEAGVPVDPPPRDEDPAPNPPAPGGVRGLPRWLVVVAAVVVLGLVAAAVGGVWIQRRIDPPGPAGEAVVVEIPPGTSTARIATVLEAEGVISDATVFEWYLRVRREGGFQAGQYELRLNSAMGDVMSTLSDGPQLSFDRLTIPEGLTLDEIAERVDGLPSHSGAALLDAAASGGVRSSYQPAEVASLEGLLFPDTYFIEDDEDEVELLRRMVETLDSVAAGLGYDDAPTRVGLTPYETLIVASLVEREARVPEDRARISRVIHNRLERGMRLEIDATVLYALGEHKDRVLFEDLEVESPYNTYRIEGLPPTPIAVPGRAAMEAALEPDTGEWLYYVVVDERGGHAFAETFAEHQANIRAAERAGVR